MGYLLQNELETSLCIRFWGFCNACGVSGYLQENISFFENVAASSLICGELPIASGV